MAAPRAALTKATERETLERFRTAAQQLPNKPEDSDDYYMRWLEAKSFNFDNALEMLKKHLIWRQKVGADYIFQWKAPEVLTKYFPGGFFGEDLDGHPVYYDFYGNIDFKGMYQSTKQEDILKLKIYHMEMANKVLKEYSEKKGRSITTITAIANMENLSYQRHYHWPSIVFIKDLFQTLADNYPELTKSVFVINAPHIFPMAYNIVKHVTEEDNRNKIVILGDNWKEELQKYISPDNLPQAYGGTRCEPDPQCSDYINWGGDIPESYYLTNQTETSLEDMETVTVGRGSSHQLEVDVSMKGTLIRWEYLSVNFDIGFGLFYKPSSTGRTEASEMTTLIASKRTDSHVVPENGYHLCTNEGTYVLRFDNTYSWTRTKEVMYSVRVLAPDTQIDQAFHEEFPEQEELTLAKNNRDEKEEKEKEEEEKSFNDYKEDEDKIHVTDALKNTSLEPPSL